MVKRDALLCLPAPDSGWEFWLAQGESTRRLRTVESPASGDFPANRDLVIGLPPSECVSLAIHLPTQDQGLFRDMTFAQLEKRGLTRDERPNAFTTYEVEPGGDGTLLSVDLLLAEEINEAFLRPNASHFASAERFYPLPEHAVVILRQHGRLVLIAAKHRRFLSSQILASSTAFDRALAQEVELDLLTLKAAWDLPDPLKVVVWAEVSPEEKEAFQLSVPVEFTAPPTPSLDALEKVHAPLLPAPVRQAQARSKRRSIVRTALLGLAALYVFAAMALAVHQHRQKQLAAALADRIESYRPEVAFIQESVARARALKPAFDKRFFPIMQLEAVARIMPPSGLVLRRFATQGTSIRVEGLAKDSQLAYQLVEDLQGHEAFAGYSWEMAPPSMNANNTASFRIEGSYALAQP